MKKILKKDLQREIIKSFPRFLSIALLIAIGVSFFIGLKSAPKIMINAGDDYLIKYHYVDLKLYSNYEVTTEDVSEIMKVKGVKEVSQQHSQYLMTKKTELATKILEYEKNQIEILEGHSPSNTNEILLDIKGKEHYEIGDSIEFSNETENEINGLSNDTFKIVGFCNYYEYLSISPRGITSIGDGNLFMFAFILPEAFLSEKANTLSILMENDYKKGTPFSNVYLNQLNKMTNAIEEKFENIQTTRKKEINQEISFSKKKLKEQKEELNKQLQLINVKIKQFEKLPDYKRVDEEINIESLETSKKTIKDNLRNIVIEEVNLDSNEEKVKGMAYTVLPINKTQSFEEFKENIQRLDILGNTIPFIFFFVASLITCVIIVCMINQEKKQIGVLKAIGVNKNNIEKKYLWYRGLSGVLGLILGLIIGIFIFPKILIGLYSPPYIIKTYPIVIYWKEIIFSLLIVSIVILVIPFFIYRNILNEKAIELLRPQKVVIGKNNIFEKVPSLWYKFPFTLKVLIRNLAFYKRRMMLILIGLVGCLSLLITGYGARNSVSKLKKSQFNELQRYSTIVGVRQQISDEDKTSLEKKLYDEYQGFLANQKELVQLKIDNDKEVSATVSSPNNNTKNNNLSEYFRLIDVKTNKLVTFSNSDVAISYKLAKLLNRNPGDNITIKQKNNKERELKISYVFQNHYEHIIYIGKDVYKKINNEETIDNYWVASKETTEKERKDLLSYPGVTSLMTREQAIEKMDLMTEQLNTIIVIIIVSSMILGFIVIYDLAYLNILERKSEIAILRTVGKSHILVSIHLFKELVLLLIITLIAGAFTGLKLYQIVMKQIELEFLSFPKIDTILVLWQSIVTLIIVFCFILFYLHQKIKKISIIESLKERE